jgi:hypothetical protein
MSPGRNTSEFANPDARKVRWEASLRDHVKALLEGEKTGMPRCGHADERASSSDMARQESVLRATWGEVLRLRPIATAPVGQVSGAHRGEGRPRFPCIRELAIASVW